MPCESHLFSVVWNLRLCEFSFRECIILAEVAVADGQVTAVPAVSVFIIRAVVIGHDEREVAIRFRLFPFIHGLIAPVEADVLLISRNAGTAGIYPYITKGEVGENIPIVCIGIIIHRLVIPCTGFAELKFIRTIDISEQSDICAFVLGHLDTFRPVFACREGTDNLNTCIGNARRWE